MAKRGGEQMSLSILLVDDNEVNLKVESIMLKKLGYLVDQATNGIEAIQALEHESYDIVLMDIQMPEMDGLEATRVIRHRWPNGPKIIVITAVKGYREICLEAEADDFLTKPVRMESLKKSIEYCIPIPNCREFESNGQEESEAVITS